MRIAQDDVEIVVSWPGRALTVPQFVKAMGGMEGIWEAVSGSREPLYAGSLAYDAGEEER